MKKSFLSLILTLTIFLISCANNITGVAATTSNETTHITTATSPSTPESPLYSLNKINDDYYIQLTEDFIPTPDHISSSIAIEFESFSEMRHRIKNNLLTKQELDTMNLWKAKDKNGIKICNLDKLYLPTTSIPLETESVYLGNSGYEMCFHSFDNNCNGSYVYFNENVYLRKLNEYIDWKTNPLITITSSEVVSERNATVTYYKTSVAELKRIEYTITDGVKTLYVEEKYILKSTNTELESSDTVPCYVTILGTCEGSYFEILFGKLSERPSFELISSFGITEYLD